MKNYKIAFFTADWNYELVETTLSGLRQYANDNENVSIRVFDCFGKDQGTVKDFSEYAIFDLADLSQFDGLLVQGSQIVLGDIRDAIARRVAEAGIPAVSIDCPIEGCTLITLDNRQAVHDMTEHVIRDHGARRLVHLTGIMGNGCPEAEYRMQGFLDACRENGIPREDAQIIECTWRTSDGLQVAQRWIREKLPLPDAFVCANDEMALGILEGLSDAGCRVPDDVIVTGFDNLSSSELSTPRLSTVNRDYIQLNYMAMDVLINKIEGLEKRDYVPFTYTLIKSESCGCPGALRSGYLRRKYYKQNRFLKNFYVLQDQMAEELFDISSLRDLRGIVEQNQEIFGCDNVYICINDYYFDNYDRTHWEHDSETFGDQMVLMTCGREGALNDPDAPYLRFPTRELLPESLRRGMRFLVFYPLHYNTYSIGYLVMDGISEAAKLNLHKSLFSFLEIAIENVRKKGLLHQLNGTLDNLYVHDALTGLYNRFGYARYGLETYRRLVSEDGCAHILFIDMDDMKGINDKYGHEYGDSAITATAQILRKIATPRDFLMRYGGDEFLMITGRGDADPSETIRRAVDDYNRRAEMPFTLSLSIGAIRATDPDAGALDMMIRAADSEMYKDKTARKYGEE